MPNHPERPAPRLLYTKKDAAYQLSLSPRSITYLITEKRIRPRYIGGRTLIPHEELLRFSRHDLNELLVAKRVGAMTAER